MSPEIWDELIHLREDRQKMLDSRKFPGFLDGLDGFWMDFGWMVLPLRFSTVFLKQSFYELFTSSFLGWDVCFGGMGIDAMMDVHVVFGAGCRRESEARRRRRLQG